MSRVLYAKMQKAGYLDPKSEKYLWVRNMEWTDPKQSKKYKGSVPRNVLPVAVTGAGDVWGIWGREVHLYYHDDGEDIFYADDLKNAVYRAVVEYLSDNDFVSDNENDENNASYAVKYVKRCIEIFSEDFSEEQINDLSKIIENDIKEYKYDNKTIYRSFISIEEADKIIHKYIEFEDEAETELSFEAEEEKEIKLSDCFSEEEIEQLRCYCREKGAYYKDKGQEYSRAVSERTDLTELWYKGGRYEPFLYQLDEIFIYNSFDIGTKKKTGSDVKGEVTIYYIDDSGSPVYSKCYLGGLSGDYSMVRFYFRPDNNTVIFNEYIRDCDKNEYKYYGTTENRFDTEGKLIAYLCYDDTRIACVDYYDYTDGRLSSCRNMNYFYVDKDIGRFENELSLEGYSNNPQNFSQSIYEEKDGAIIAVQKIKCNDEGCKYYEHQVTEKIYKAVKKKKII